MKPPVPIHFSPMVLALACIFACVPGVAKELPLWEVGIGAAGVTLPDYRGSDEQSTYLLPAPYFVYRGEYLKADRNGLRTNLFGNDRIEVNLSANATLPVRSRDNYARRGMPDLKPTVEIGGNVSLTMWKAAGDRAKLDLRLPVRTAITIESSPEQVGWLFAPNINLDVESPPGLPGWQLGMLAGPLINSRRYNGFFYTVTPAQALPDRPAYTARGGYSGSQFTMALSRRYNRYWVGGFLRYDTLRGAAFEDSPLVRKRSVLYGGVAFTWIFGMSTTLVEASE
jgi:outer membrane scaffolding protein for murein synthesis (MipA/OmpV family)